MADLAPQGIAQLNADVAGAPHANSQLNAPLADASRGDVQLDAAVAEDKCAISGHRGKTRTLEKDV